MFALLPCPPTYCFIPTAFPPAVIFRRQLLTRKNKRECVRRKRGERINLDVRGKPDQFRGRDVRRRSSRLKLVVNHLNLLPERWIGSRRGLGAVHVDRLAV